MFLPPAERPGYYGYGSSWLGGDKGKFTVFLYIAYCKGHAKVGLSQRPQARLMQMQNGCPFPIELLASIPLSEADAPKAEHATLLALSERHAIGDWFKCPRSQALHAAYTASRVFTAPGLPIKPPRSTSTGGPRGRPPKGGRSRSIVTPHGNFPSLQAAATHLNITRQAVESRLRRKSPGWEYIYPNKK